MIEMPKRREWRRRAQWLMETEREKDEERKRESENLKMFFSRVERTEIGKKAGEEKTTS